MTSFAIVPRFQDTLRRMVIGTCRFPPESPQQVAIFHSGTLTVGKASADTNDSLNLLSHAEPAHSPLEPCHLPPSCLLPHAPRESSGIIWDRLSRHGFTDVMKDTANSFAKESGRAGEHKKIAVDLNLEVTDPLAKHEITLQFAAFRAAAVGGGNGGGGGVAGGSRGGAGNGGGGGGVPISLYFTYQLYTCRPTRTERMILRPDSPKDRLYQVNTQHVLVE